MGERGDSFVLFILQSGAVVARVAHNHKVKGSIPFSAPIFLRRLEPAKAPLVVVFIETSNIRIAEQI